MNAFNHLNGEVRKVIDKFGYKQPTVAQDKSIPVIMSGHHTLLIAPTGSGKTEAALFPIFSKIVEEKPKHGILALYITPLRALNRDVFRRMAQIASELKISLSIRHGDTPQRIRRMQALKPPHILITTPETLQAILPGKIMKEHLRNVKWVIIDEIHELACDKRGAQLALALERLREITGGEFQRIGLSATIGSPKLIGKFLAGSNRDVRVVNVSAEKKYEVIVDVADEKIEDKELAIKLEVPTSTASKLRYIIDVIRKKKSTLIFTNTREMAEVLASRLKVLDQNLKIKVHHGSLSREERIEAEGKFKRGELNALICTSSLELGLDIGVADYVIQYMSPRQATKLIQRIGRAGHKLWETSRGLIITSNVDDILESTAIARRALKWELEEIQLYDKPLDVLAHQLVGLAMDLRIVKIEKVLEIARRAYPFRNLSPEEIERVAELMDSIGILKYDSESKIIRLRKGAWKYYYENLSVIPDVRKFTVIDIASRKPVGDLDEEFVAIYGFKNEPFILAGRTWKVVRISEDECKVYAIQVENELGAIPAWIGELIPVPFEVAQEVGELREKVVSEGMALNGYPITHRALEKARRELEEHLKCGLPLPTSKRIVIEGLGSIVVIHSCLGTKANKALSILLAHELTNRLKCAVKTYSDSYRVLLNIPKAIRAKSIANLIMQLANGITEEEVRKAVKSSDVFKWKLYHVAKRFGVISKEAPLSKVSKIIGLLEETPVEEEAVKEAIHDYFNVRKLMEYLAEIKRGEVELAVHEGSIKDGASTLAYYVLNAALPYDIIPPKKAVATLIEVVKNRLMNREVLLICVYCADWHTVRKVKYIPDEVRCPKCGAKAIGVAHPSQAHLVKLVKRWRKKRGKIRRSEMDELEKLKRTVGLVMTYGKKAIIALSARGIGPTTASKILSKYHENEEEFYADILEAEKEYLRTRPYWN